MRVLGSVQAVRSGIAAEAGADFEALDARTAEAERAAAETTDGPPPVAAGAQTAQTRRRAAQRLDVAAWEERRAWAEAREAWMEEVSALGLARLTDAPADPDVLARLADEALAVVPGEVARVVVRPRDLERLPPDWRAERARRAGKREVEVAEGEVPGGLRVESADGRVALDQTWPTRAERAARRWRPVLARLFAADDAEAT